MTGSLHEYHLSFFIISRSVLLKMINVSDTKCRGNQNTHFVFSDFFRKSCRLWDVKSTVERSWPQMTGWRIHIACWIPNATNTHTQVVLRPRSHVPIFDRPGADRTGDCTTWNFKTSPVLTGRSIDEVRCDRAVVHAQ